MTDSPTDPVAEGVPSDVAPTVDPNPDGSGRPARLFRSKSDRMLAGVCGGLGEYFGVDPVWFRIGFVLLGLGGGSSVLLYLLFWIVMPEATDDGEGREWPSSSAPPASVIVGLILIAVGGMILVNVMEPSIGRFFWPLALVCIGLAVIAGGRSRDRR